MTVILGSSCSSFYGDKNVHPLVSYWITFISFPLNQLAFCIIFSCWCLFYSESQYIRTLSWAYVIYLVIDIRRCDGIGYPMTFPFKQIRNVMRNNFIYNIACAYYPIKVHKTCELPSIDKDGKKCKYMFATHPHGVFAVGTMAVFGSNGVGFDSLFPGIEPYIMGLRTLFYVPFFRELLLFGGAFSADKTSFKHIFEDKQGSAAILIGGAAEALVPFIIDPVTGKATLRCLLKNRKGFIKIALQHGVSLVPVLCLEENLVFQTISPSRGGLAHKVQMRLQKSLSFALPLFWGNQWVFMPKRQEINVFVGKPISCERVQDGAVSSDEIDTKHAEYCAELVAMFHLCKKEIELSEKWDIELISDPFKAQKDSTKS